MYQSNSAVRQRMAELRIAALYEEAIQLRRVRQATQPLAIVSRLSQPLTANGQSGSEKPLAALIYRETR